jgi:hypothetical protein
MKRLFALLTILSFAFAVEGNIPFQGKNMSLTYQDISYNLQANQWEEITIPGNLYDRYDPSAVDTTMQNFVAQLTQNHADEVDIVWGREWFSFKWQAYSPILENFYQKFSESINYLDSYEADRAYYIKTNADVNQTMDVQLLGYRSVNVKEGWNMMSSIDKVISVQSIFNLFSNHGIDKLWVKDNEGLWRSYASAPATVDEQIGLGKMIYFHLNMAGTDHVEVTNLGDSAVIDDRLQAEQNISNLIIDNDIGQLSFDTVKLFTAQNKIDENVTTMPDLQFIGMENGLIRIQFYLHGIYAGDNLVQVRLVSSTETGNEELIIDIDLSSATAGDIITFDINANQTVASKSVLRHAPLVLDNEVAGAFSQLQVTGTTFITYPSQPFEHQFTQMDINDTHVTLSPIDFFSGHWQVEPANHASYTYHSDSNITFEQPDGAILQLTLQNRQDVTQIGNYDRASLFDYNFYEVDATLKAIQAPNETQLHFMPIDHNVSDFSQMVSQVTNDNILIHPATHAMLESNGTVVEGALHSGCEVEPCWERTSTAIGTWETLTINGNETIKIDFTNQPDTLYLRVQNSVMEVAYALRVNHAIPLKIYFTSEPVTERISEARQLVKTHIFETTNKYTISDMFYDHTYYTIKLPTDGTNQSQIYKRLFYTNSYQHNFLYDSASDNYPSSRNVTFTQNKRGVLENHYGSSTITYTNAHFRFNEAGRLEVDLYERPSEVYFGTEFWFSTLEEAKQFAFDRGISY